MSLGRAFFVDGAGNWRALGGLIIPPFDPPPPEPDFTIGVTRPTKSNTGPDPSHTLVPYVGPNSGGVLTITTPVTYTDVDFGATNTRVRINSSDVHFVHCRFVNKSAAIYTSDPGPLADCRGGNTYTNRTFYRCSFDNVHQWSSVVQAVMGYGFTMERCWAENFQDDVGVYVSSGNIDGPLNVSLLGCYFGPMSFWYSPTGGQVHSSDTKSHNDVIQWQGGRGLYIDGCDIVGQYSLTIGTGTPNSGSNTAGFGASGAPYTQAAGVTARFNIVEGGGTFSAGMPGAFLGGSISGLMFTPVGRGNTPVAVVRRCWASGGAFWANAGADTLANASGVPWTFEFTENRVDNNQRHPGFAFGIQSTVSANVPTTGPLVNTWTDGTGTIAKRSA